MVKLKRVSVAEKYNLESYCLTLEAQKDFDDLKEHLGDDLFDDYMKIRNKISDSEWKDFGKLKKKDPEEVRDFVNNFQSESDKRKEAKKGANKIYEDDDWLVYRITTYPAAQYYGKNTKWCITGRYPGHEGRGEEYFYKYIEDEDLDGGYYFYINKHDDTEKYCVLQSKYGDVKSVWDAPDTNRGSSLSEIDVSLPEVPGVNLYYILSDTLEDLIINDDVDEVEEYIEDEDNEVKIDGYFDDGSTPLTCAIENDCSTDMINVLIEHGANINKTDKGGSTPLYYAIENSPKEIVEILLKNGADPNKENNDRLPIFQALRRNSIEDNIDFLKLLIKFGADINKEEKYYHAKNVTPLDLAIVKSEKIPDFIKIVNLLLDNGATVTKDAFREIIWGNNIDLLKTVLNNGADPNLRFDHISNLPYNTTGLHLAACEKSKTGLEKMQLLVKAGADIDAKDNSDNTPLLYACIYDITDNAKFLLENGADPNVRNSNGITPLSSACENENLDLVKLLVNHGAKVELRSVSDKDILFYLMSHVDLKDSKTRIEAQDALYEYAYQDNTELMRALIDAGVDVNSEHKGQPIIQGACLGGSLNAVKLLLKNGADINKKDDGGATCLSNAIFSNNKNLVSFLIKNGIDINHQNKDGMCALRSASIQDKYDMVELLLKNGADVTLRDYENKTPLDVARSQKVKDLLIQYGAKD